MSELFACADNLEQSMSSENRGFDSSGDGVCHRGVLTSADEMVTSRARQSKSGSQTYLIAL